MMQAIPEDYVAPEIERNTFADGEYKFKGIRWFTLDERQNPILKAQKDGRMVGRFHAVMEDDSEGPPMSVELSQMALLVQVFGVPVTALPVVPTLDKPGKIAEYMTKVEQLIEASGKVVTGVVANGWINSINGMDVTGYIYFMLDDILCAKDADEPAPRQPSNPNWSPFFLLSFVVLGGEGGVPTPFAGAHFTELLNYAVVAKTDADGSVTCDWTRNSKGEFNAAAVVQSKLMKWTAPSMFADDYTTNNPENVLPEWLREAKKKNQVLKGYRAKPAKGDRVSMQWATVEPVYDFKKPSAQKESVAVEKPPQPVKQIEAPETKVNGRDDMAARLLLRELISTLTEGNAFDGDTFELTRAGKVTAKKYLTPLREKGLIPTGMGMLIDLVFEDIERIFKHIEVPDDKKEAVTVLRHKLAEVGLLGEGSDQSDF